MEMSYYKSVTSTPMSLSIRSITIALKPVFITNYFILMGITMLIELMQGSI